MHEMIADTFDYNALDEETREFVYWTADEIHGLLKRTVANIIKIGQLLHTVKERLPYGQFLPWIQTEFALSRWTAQNFMRVAEKFGDTWGNFHHMPASVLYELAAPSTSEAILEQVQSGHLPPTLDAIKAAKAAEQRARTAEQQALAEQAALRAQLAQERASAAAQIRQLSLETERVQQQLDRLSASPVPQSKEVPVVPVEVSAQLHALQEQVKSLSAQRDALVLQAEQLEARAQEVAAKRKEEQYAREICLAWSNATAALHTSLLKFLTQFPTPQQVQVFEAMDWNRLAQAQTMLQRVLDECERLRQGSQGVVVEAASGASAGDAGE